MSDSVSQKMSFLFNPLNRQSAWRDGTRVHSLAKEESSRAYLLSGDKIFFKKDNFLFKINKEDEAYFLGGLSKDKVLKAQLLRPCAGLECALKLATSRASYQTASEYGPQKYFD